MKKTLLLLLISTTVFLSSCTKEYNDYYDMIPTITMVYQQDEADWKGTENDAYITLKVPELTKYYIDQGVISVAISTDNERTYYTIPSTFDGVAYSYRYGVGEITIRAQDPILEDGIEVTVPNKAFIKVSLTEADWID